MINAGRVGVVLDQAGMVSFARGDSRVAELIVETAAQRLFVGVPAVALLAAHAAVRAGNVAHAAAHADDPTAAHADDPTAAHADDTTAAHADDTTAAHAATHAAVPAGNAAHADDTAHADEAARARLALLAVLPAVRVLPMTEAEAAAVANISGPTDLGRAHAAWAAEAHRAYYATTDVAAAPAHLRRGQIVDLATGEGGR